MNSTGTVTWAVTNWSNGVAAASATIIQPVADTPLLDGNYLVTGLPQRFVNTTGTWAAVLEQGNYRLSVEGQPSLQDIYFSLPGDGGSYDVADIRLSGGNVFVQSGVQKLTSADGSLTLTPSIGQGVVDLHVTTPGVSKVESSDASVSVVTTSGTANLAITAASVLARLVSNGDVDLSSCTSVTLPGPIYCQDTGFTINADGILGVRGTSSYVTTIGVSGLLDFVTRYYQLTASSVTVTLPILTTLNATYPNGVEITIINGSTGSCAVQASSGDAITPGGTVTLNATGRYVSFKSIGQTWWVVGSN